MRRLLSFAALCTFPLLAPSVSAQPVRADPVEIVVPGKPIVRPETPLAPVHLRVAPALKVRYALPPRQPDGRPHPDEGRLLNENEAVTQYNLKHLEAWLIELAGGGWTEHDRTAAESALEDLRTEYAALAAIDALRERPLPRLSVGRLQKPLRPERIGAPDAELRRENLMTARYNFLVTKANVIQAETLPYPGQDIESARNYHASAAKILSDLEAREQEGRSGAAQGVRKAREALKGAGPIVPD